MIIEKIIKLKDNKYKIIIDDKEIITFDDVILENGLLHKKSIDNNMYINIINSTEYYNIYNKVVKYILKKRRSENEIKEYLNKQNLKQDDIDKMLKKLKDINLINDLEYTKAFINDKVYLSKSGINKIRMELKNQDIPSHIIENELEKINEEVFDDRLEKMIVKKIKANKKHSNNQLKQKILNDMLNLGYDKNKIIKMINNNIEFNSNIIEKEFNKIYNNLIKKYNDKEVFIKLKQKLLYKGFELEDINNLIQKKQN